MSKRRPRIPRNVLILSFVALASGFGQDLISPALPGFLLLLGMSRWEIGLIDGLLQGTTNLFRFISGWLSDKTARRKPLVFAGYALSSIARPILALAGGIASIAAIRIGDGAGKGMKDAPRDALIAEASAAGTRGRSFGFQRMIDTTGSVLGPLVAFGILIALGASLTTYRFIFLLSAIPGACALLLIWIGVRERARKTQPDTTPRAILGTRYWIFTAATSIAMLTKINDSLFLVRAQDTGIPNTWIPLLFGGFTLIYAILSYPIGIWSDRIGKLPLILSGWMVLALTEFGFSTDPSIPAALALFAAYGLFFALTEGSGRAFIADEVPAASRGRAYGIFYTMTGVALIAGGYFLGLVWDRETPEIAFRIAAAGSATGSLLLCALLLRSRKPSAHRA